MIAVAVIRGLVARDLVRLGRQRSRLIGGLARPLLWVFLVGSGLEGIAQPGSGEGYRAFAYPGGIAMAVLFGGMLTAIGTVYDREFGMLRLQLASPAGTGVILAGRACSATMVGVWQGAVVLLLAPLVLPLTLPEALLAAVALVPAAMASAALGLLVASRLQSVESFGGVINTVLFPLLFVSGAFYPVAGMPAALAAVAQLNPVTAIVDLLRHAMGRTPEFALGRDLAILAATTGLALAGAALGFDPERRILGRRDRR